ncbi:unnamed protein product [Ambrosiozyma monospora]|uniref:Unnamed protein product n=1 Tax=Ambrosiozyma monospora TaxID=43982 RepID=A0A9W6YX26_AMBMO|nr:unnamed protein product [Ambrosiozyma monospora]
MPYIPKLIKVQQILIVIMGLLYTEHFNTNPHNQPKYCTGWDFPSNPTANYKLSPFLNNYYNYNYNTSYPGSGLDERSKSRARSSNSSYYSSSLSPSTGGRSSTGSSSGAGTSSFSSPYSSRVSSLYSPSRSQQQQQHNYSYSNSSATSSSSIASYSTSASSVASIYNDPTTVYFDPKFRGSRSYSSTSVPASASAIGSATRSDPSQYLNLAEPKLKVLRCQQCHSQICLSSKILSDNFYGNKGPAWFVSGVINCKFVDPSAAADTKRFKTGNYKVKSICCQQCEVTLGWKYLLSEDDSEKYKEGNFVIERNLLEQVDDY